MVTAAAREYRDGEVRSLPIRFDDGTPEGLVPVTGLFYGGTPGSQSER